MAATEWKGILKALLDASYEKVLRDIPEDFSGLTRTQKREYKRQLSTVRRHAVFDICMGVAMVVGNGVVAVESPAAGVSSLAVSAGGGAILFRRGGHALIKSRPRV